MLKFPNIRCTGRTFPNVNSCKKRRGTQRQTDVSEITITLNAPKSTDLFPIKYPCFNDFFFYDIFAVAKV